MTDQSLYDRALSEYTPRLFGACGCTSVAVVASEMLINGSSGRYWWLALMAACATATVGLNLTIEVSKRWSILRRLRLVDQVSKPYGYAGPEEEQSAVNRMKQTKVNTRKPIQLN